LLFNPLQAEAKKIGGLTVKKKTILSGLLVASGCLLVFKIFSKIFEEMNMAIALANFFGMPSTQQQDLKKT
jgi:hypothetical protein